MAACLAEWDDTWERHPGLPHICTSLRYHDGLHRCQCNAEAKQIVIPSALPDPPKTAQILAEKMNDLIESISKEIEGLQEERWDLMRRRTDLILGNDKNRSPK